MLYNVLAVLIGLLVMPIMLIWLWKTEPKCILEWILNFLMIGLFVLFMYFSGLWAYITGYYAKYLVLVLFVFIAFITSKKARHLNFLCTPTKASKFSFCYKTLLIFVFLFINLSIMFSFFNKEDIVNLSFPFKDGDYYVAHGGNSSILNYHNSSPYMKYAIDMVKLNEFGFRADGLFPKQLEKYKIYGEKVFSPCSGKVIEAVDGREDYPPGIYMPNKRKAQANYIIIETGNIRVRMVHFQKDSIKVQAGDNVKDGQLIGLVGDSGLSFEPHLHMHVTQNGYGVKFMLNGKYLKRNDLIKIDD